MNKSSTKRTRRTATLVSAATLLFCMTDAAQAKGPASSQEYKDAYACATENLQEGGSPGSATSFCVGNSRDPSKAEERAYRDAEQNFAKKQTKTNKAAQSPEYAEAYKCAMESLNEGYSAGAAAFCVGNSRDPSKTEERAYADAEREFTKR